MRKTVIPALLLALVSTLLGCGNLNRTAVSPSDLVAPDVPGIPGARYWADTPPENLDEVLRETFEQRRKSGVGRNGRKVLVISGGAEKGAYGAGLLTAWTDKGNRPEFTTVTGVSTGALIAPFAFLGSAYDPFLKRFYGDTPANEIFRSKGLFGAAFSVSLANNAPLRQIVEETVTPQFLAEIAREHERGRRLLVQSLSLDAQRPVLWDMGRIASSASPNAEALFENVLIASASIPGAFPPVLIPVETADGIKDEMHIDGAIYSSATALDAWYLAEARRELPQQAETIYIIRNFEVLPDPEATKGKLVPIAARALDTIVKTQGTDDLLELYVGASDAGSRYHVTWIGSGFTRKPEEPFEQAYMQALFQYGYEKMSGGKAWQRLPPQLMTQEKVRSIH